MDSKGIDLPGMIPAVANLARTDKKNTTAVPPVEKSGKGMLRTALDKDKMTGSEETSGEMSMTPEERATLAAEILAEGLQSSQNLEVSWSVHEETGQLVVEIRDKKTGEILRQVPPEDILKGADHPTVDPQGLLVDKTA